MTTIAANRECMAADSRVTWGGIPSITRKIVRLPDALVATAGCDQNGRLFVGWFRESRKLDEKPEFDLGEDEEDGFVALVLTKDGLFWYSYKCIGVPVEDQWAIGSGQEVAIAAMRIGKNPGRP